MSGDTDSALMMYLHLGELGIEVAQCNAAFMFEEGVLELFILLFHSLLLEETDMLNKTEILKRALLLWSRSATQGNPHSYTSILMLLFLYFHSYSSIYFQVTVLLGLN